ncbi:tetratricopeptide repeat protein [Crossiella sp. CA198]|uniref:tetratricopeptide repeat protein n=1 Tax=Crossiella sp. CA198 TaxID=3455607 RepID=UPI003F8D808F
MGWDRIQDEARGLLGEGAVTRLARLVRRELRHRPEDPELHIQLGRIALVRVQLDLADLHFTRAAELAPEQPRPHGWLVAVLHWRNQYEQALATVAAARARWPEDVELRVAQARLHYSLGDYPAALAVTEEVPFSAAKAEDAVEWRLAALRRLHRHPESEQLAREFLAEFAADVDVHDELVRSLRGQGRHAEAVAAANALHERFPRRITAILTHADTLQAAGEQAEAVRLLTAAVRARPHLYALRHALGKAHTQVLDHPKAIAEFAATARLNPGQSHGWWQWASSLCLADRLPEATAVLAEAARGLPHDADIRTEQAELVEAEQGAAAALPIAESALELDQANQWTPRLVARLRRQSGAAAEAETLLRGLVANRPYDNEFVRELGWHLREEGRAEDAVTLYRTVLDRIPANVEVGIALGSLLRTLDRAGEAVTVLRQCLTHRPRHAELWEDLGRSLEIQRDHEAAESAYRTATELAPADAEGWYARIGHLMTRGRLAEAGTLLDTALERCPDAESLHRRRIALLQDTAGDEVVEAALRTAIARFPDSANLPLDLVRHLSWGRRFSTALSEVDSRLAADPADEDLLYWRIQLLFSLNRRTEARAAAVAAHRELPESARLSFLNAWSLIEIDQEVAAEAALVAAHAAHPADRVILRGLVRCLRRLSRVAETEPLLRTALAKEPDAVDLWVELAWTLEQLFRFDDAIGACEKALVLNAEHNEAFGGAIRLRYQVGRAEEADRLVAAEVSRRPWDSGLWQEISSARLSARRLAEAVTAARNAVDRAPGDATLWLLLTETLLESGRVAEAAQVTAEAVLLHPHNPPLRHRQSRVAWVQGRAAESEALLRAAMAELPEVTSVGHDLVNHLRARHRHEEALAVLAGLGERDPGNQRVHLHRIRTLRSACRFAEARLAADAALALFPWSTDLRTQHARILVREGRIEAALAEYTAIAEVDPVGPQGLSGRLDCLGWLGRQEQAVRELRAGARAHPDRISLRLQVVWLELQLGRLAEARAELDRITGQFEPTAEIIQAKVRLLFVRKLFPEATAEVEAGLALFPADTGLMLLQGNILDGQNRYADALDCFDRILAQAPLSVGTITAKSATLRSLGRFREARQLMETALADRPTQPELLAERGWVHRDQGRSSLARKDFSALLELAEDPDEKLDALRGLGWVAFADGDFAEAAARFRAAALLDPEDAAVKCGLAWTLVRGGEPEHEEEAERLCLDVLNRDPVNLLAHTCAGVLYARQRDYPLAEHHLRRTITLDPFNGSYVDLGALLAQLERFGEAEELFDKALARDFYDAQAHVELGSLLLQRDQDGAEPGADARAAAQHFRQALLCEPRSGAAAIGLALALARSPGDLVAAERVLRDALERTDCDAPAWQLRLTLARLLVERGDATQRREFHLEALALAQQAIGAAATEPEPYFVAGVAAFKIGENGAEVQARPAHRRRAVRFLRRCLEREPGHVEARRLIELATHSLAVARRSLVGSAALVSVATSLLVALWVGFFFTDKVNTVVLATLTPVLTGLVALGFVLPLLVKLKLPGGVEADLAASMNQLSAGPTGELSYGPGRLVGHRTEGRPDRSLNAGPRGELPRLG